MGFDLEELKHQVPLLDYIKKEYPEIDVREIGQKSFVTCPYHDERTPSCLINDDDTFHCYSCNEHGSIIDFVAAKEGLDPNTDFKDLCIQIGERIGMEIRFTPPDPEVEKYIDEKHLLAKRYYESWKNDPDCNDAYYYLTEERGLTPQTIFSFKLGYVPMDEYKRRRDISYISGRIAFPILEMKSSKDMKKVRCIGMGYRTLLKDANEPKYVNDPTKEGVFNKRNVLYGYAHAVEHIRQAKSVIVVEGYMDVISMHQANLKNTVGCMGTALTEEQMDILRRLTSNLFIFMDSDCAGQKNMLRVLPTLLKKGFNVRIIDGKNGLDPADICLKSNFNPAKVRQYIKENSEYAVLSVINQACSAYEDVVLRERLKAVHATSPILECIQSQSERKIYEDLLQKRLDIKGVF